MTNKIIPHSHTNTQHYAVFNILHIFNTGWFSR